MIYRKEDVNEMKEILVCGDPGEEFEKNFYAKLTWEGYGWNKDEELRIYEIDEDGFEKLFKESLVSIFNDVKCVYSEGCNLALPTNVSLVNGRKLTCWNDLFFGQDAYRNKYMHLLHYIADNFKVKEMVSVWPIIVELSKYNDMSLIDLLKVYQEFEIRIERIKIHDEIGIHDLTSKNYIIKCGKCHKERSLYDSDMINGTIVPSRCSCGGENEFRYWLDNIYSDEEYKELEIKASLLDIESKLLSNGYSKEKIEEIRKEYSSGEEYLNALEKIRRSMNDKL
ncbi:hypothetical protein [Clostridium saccharoperbutylacetonicum]|uniref:hypothetical protein n=1 Tax=Clostridium saccharoperbutylacetonicum TaxID=36745 RepID=UPI0039EAAFEE